MMDNLKFEKLKSEFSMVDTDKKIDLYVTTEGLNEDQYKELLRIFPYNEIHKLEKALA